MDRREVMEEPIRVLQWGMTDGLGGLETFMMNVYRYIDRNKVQFDFLLSHDASPLVFEHEIKQLGGRVFRVMYPAREFFDPVLSRASGISNSSCERKLPVCLSAENREAGRRAMQGIAFA